MASMNANCEFIFLDVGKNARISDGGVSVYNVLPKAVEKLLKPPDNSEIEENLNFIFVADDGFWSA
jgi:hypothetical protein